VRENIAITRGIAFFIGTKNAESVLRDVPQALLQKKGITRINVWNI
jgi:hypothetical protein